MPLVRVEVRNEYRLGMPELYTEANREDPKAVLEGVAVAGLVGILRQLGDLAEFAAEVFHGLQEQVLITSSRSHKLIVRLHNIEAALPPLEKAILAQRSHLHFAYTAGSQWHARLRNEGNHFIYNDLPRFIMDSYEECRDVPCLHKLDKFDAGGSGSCFKRYSDPTFFKKASVGLNEAHLQNIPREKRARKTKKKRMWPRHREASHGAPASFQGGRTDYDSPNFVGQEFPMQEASTFDVAHKPEIDGHLASFNSRAGSGYIESIFRPSFSTQSEENETKEILSSDLKQQHNVSPDPDPLDDKSAVGENISTILLQKDNGPSSSSVTWDEKAEIMEPTGEPNEKTEILCTNDNLANEGIEALNFRAIDQVDLNFDHEQFPISVTGRDLHDEIESETDYYMDALNTIESESETDLDCQTKRELHRYSSMKMKDVIEQSKEGHSEESSVTVDLQVKAFTSSDNNISGLIPQSTSTEAYMKDNNSLNNGRSEDQINSDLSESVAKVCSPQRVDSSSVPCASPEIFMPGNPDVLEGSSVLTVTSNGLPSSSRESASEVPPTEKIFDSCESAKLPSVTSDVHPVMFWTNGSLLGLEPSKPPDFGLPTAGGQDPVVNGDDDIISHSSQRRILNDNGHAVRTDTVAHSSKVEWPSEVADSNNCNRVVGHNSNAPNAVPSETDGPVNLDGTEQTSRENGVGSSRIFEFSNRLLANGFRRKVSLVGDEKLASSLRSDIPEKMSMHKSHQTFMRTPFREEYASVSPITSPCSSPLLKHMKISFQPIDGFETSKLKLKFPDWSNCSESCGDIFPSFQLIPDLAISLHDSDSDTDDDTFCRSSPYISDDCRSHHSESNSEQWESSESPGSKDHGLDDAFYRNPSKESASSSLATDQISQRGFSDVQSPFIEDGMEPSHSGHMVDITNFDSLNVSFNQDNSNCNGKYTLDSQFPKEPTPPPPPLPPLEWRGIKPNPDMETKKEYALPEASTSASDLKLRLPMISQQPKQAPSEPEHFAEKIEHTPSSKIERQKVNSQKGANQIRNGKMEEEKDDFLQQIRTKSFNLRRTATARPTITPGGPPNFKVTAILEKANAIRQAVGSDDGEDEDNWSDT